MTPQKKVWIVKEILTWMVAKFQTEKIQNSLLDAQLLLCYVLKYKNRVDLYLNSEKILRQNELASLRELIKRRLSHEPLAYIINQKYWYNLDLYVDSNVLIPRPETESLLDFIIETIQSTHCSTLAPYDLTVSPRGSTVSPRNLTVSPCDLTVSPRGSTAGSMVIFDFCTGSGCLAIALGKIFTTSKVYAFDISTQALEIAKKNALRNQIDNIEFIQLDLTNDSSYEFLQSNLPKADIIVANPPYVNANDWDKLPPDVRFEPKISLISNDNGLSIGKKIYDAINHFELLNTKSIFGMELDHLQPKKLLENQEQKKVFSLKSQNCEKPMNEWFILKDLELKERFLIKISE